MPLLLASGLSKSYGDTRVLTDASLALEPGEKAALVGRNGVGKTTLLRLLAGLEAPDRGTRALSGGATVGYLPQDPTVDESRTLWDEASEPFAHLAAAERQLTDLEAQLASPEIHGDDGRLSAVLDEYGRLRDEFETRGGFRYEAAVRRTLRGLEFREEQFRQPFSSMSGGQRSRAALARLLLSAPDLLLLDEPTNHLDLNGQEWLEAFLKDYPGAMLLVSHDRFLLDAVTTRTIELDEGTLEEYAASYSGYAIERLERQAQRQELFERQQEEIENLKAYIRRYRAGQKSRQAKSREKRLARIEPVTAPRSHRSAAIRLETPRRNPQIVLRLRGVTKRFGDLQVLRDVSLEVRRGEKIGLIGPNGAGKTTLLRMVARMEEPTSGQVDLAPGIRVGYFAQHSEETLDLNQTVLDEVLGARPITPAQVRGLLGRFLFSGEDVFKKIDQLSGGERRRVALAKLVLDRPDVLLLDEPTTHLDLPTLEALEAALSGFPGAMLFVSHDRYFLDRLAERLVVLGDGIARTVPGPYHKYREALAAAPSDGEPVPGTARAAVPRSGPREGPRNPGRSDTSRAQSAAQPAGSPPGGERQREGPRKRRVSGSDRVPAGQEPSADELMQRIARLEQEVKDLSRAMGDPELYRDADRARQTVQQYDDATTALEALYAELEQAG